MQMLCWLAEGRLRNYRPTDRMPDWWINEKKKRTKPGRILLGCGNEIHNMTRHPFRAMCAHIHTRLIKASTLASSYRLRLQPATKSTTHNREYFTPHSPSASSFTPSSPSSPRLHLLLLLSFWGTHTTVISPVKQRKNKKIGIPYLATYPPMPILPFFLVLAFSYQWQEDLETGAPFFFRCPLLFFEHSFAYNNNNASEVKQQQ